MSTPPSLVLSFPKVALLGFNRILHPGILFVVVPSASHNTFFPPPFSPAIFLFDFALSSWGADWGEDGYIRLAMGHNTCGIANVATVPMMF